ncbi:polysaccharide deacetylase family protein [Streptomyces sp. NPDC057638]|uniref:polysaccharide deacetylase family protein n=1 Tax=Streptomyces sp. NPDC057638 TaxID=3346190 RepID=UPI00369C6B0C
MISMDRRRALRTATGATVAATLTAGCAGAGPAEPAGPRDAGPPDAGVIGGDRGERVGEAGGDGGARASGGSPSPSPHPAPSPRRHPRHPDQITHGPRDRDRVALTFHGAGDPATARALLAEAERAGARVTVLAVGAWLDDHPELARRILDGGHDLGNHTQNHLTITEMTEADARAEITECATRLRRLTGSIGTWFRPSRTQYAPPSLVRLARLAGYPHVLSYDLDSLDATSPGATAVISTVTGRIQRGSVVSLHFGYADTVAALPAVLDDLHRRRLRAVTTTELLS